MSDIHRVESITFNCKDAIFLRRKLIVQGIQKDKKHLSMPKKQGMKLTHIAI